MEELWKVTKEPKHTLVWIWTCYFQKTRSARTPLCTAVCLTTPYELQGLCNGNLSFMALR